MAPEAIILLALFEFRLNAAAFGGAHLAVMPKHALRKAARLPSFHSRFRYGHQINSTTLGWQIAADLFIALATEQLNLPRYVLDTGEAIIVLLRVLNKRSPTNAQFWIGSEFANQEFKIVRLERHIRIQV